MMTPALDTPPAVAAPRGIPGVPATARPTRRVRALRLGVALVALSALAGFGIQYLRTRPPPPTRYLSAKVDRGPIASKVTATGTLSALVTVLVGSQVSGRIAALYADFNSPVHAGQVIAKLDPQLFEAAFEQAQANYGVALANLQRAKIQALDIERQTARTVELGKKKLLARADVDTAEANAAAARAQITATSASVRQALAALHQAKVNLKYTTIVSPIDGVVISRAVDVGQTVAASLQAPTLFTIAQDLTKMQVHTSVAEGDVGKLRAGMRATFTVDAYPNRRFEGVVPQVRDAATTVQSVVTYDAVVDVDNGERLLKPGMTATVTFTPEQKRDVLRIPNAALRFRPDAASLALRPQVGARREPRGDRRTVYRLEGETPTPVEVQIGITDGSDTEVVSGKLSVGDAVILEALPDDSSRSAART